MKTIFLINPVAGNGKALKKWLHLKSQIRSPHEVIQTEKAGHATELVQRFADEGERALVVGIGGDGTMREIITAAAGVAHLSVGFVPAGSGNDFARGFASFKHGADIERYLAQQTERPHDLGQVGENDPIVFVSSTGIGFDAEVTARVNKSPLKKALNRIGMGKLAYALLVANSLVKFQPFTLEVAEAGEVRHFEDVWLATISNQPFFGGGMKLSPTSKTDDGKLEITVVHGIRRLKLLLVFGTVFTGSHLRLKEVDQWHSEAFQLKTDAAVSRHADGDAAGTTPPNDAVLYTTSKKRWLLARNQT
ncbi:diacylglycerol kinase family protein [Planomicrobium sp. YIM 101495]|uniref:diacylglycerol/lipid kinase family protein n=1 Tax=Planomicrobium sp. YIM 101495 TaxID=2665160 RepID=UPI0013F6B101|nr:YegS/Rv2252/BmrU family lipid kinase [Planomicrobium sp. YIM 101495]